MAVPGAPGAVTFQPGLPATGLHGYFERLTRRPDLLAAYALRSQAEIDRYRTKPSQPPNVTYGPDPDPRRQDAAKITIPADKVSLPTQVRLPIPDHRPQSVFVTWDAWFGLEMAYGHAGIGRFKTFQFASPQDRIWTEVRSGFIEAAQQRLGMLAMVDIRQYGGDDGIGPGTFRGPFKVNGINYGQSAPGPMQDEFFVQAETWTRYFVLFEPRADQTAAFSVWIADTQRDAVQMYDGILLKPNAVGYWPSFWLEYNTSTNQIPADRGPLVGYVRNVAMLKGLSPLEATTLLERPRG